MRTFASDHRGKRCAGVVAAALAVMALVYLSPSAAMAQPTAGTSGAAASADVPGEHTPLAIVPAVVVAATWLWRARTAAVTAKHHVLAPSTMRDTTVGERAAAFDLDLRDRGDCP
jgi:hypothetical protein